MKVVELFPRQRYIERRKPAEFEAESLRIRQNMGKEKARAKVLDEVIENENTEERKSDGRDSKMYSRNRYVDDQNLKEQVPW